MTTKKIILFFFLLYAAIKTLPLHAMQEKRSTDITEQLTTLHDKLQTLTTSLASLKQRLSDLAQTLSKKTTEPSKKIAPTETRWVRVKPSKIEQTSFETFYIGAHRLDIQRLEKFESLLKQKEQDVFSGQILECFFAADSDKDFENLLLNPELLKQQTNTVRTKLAKKWIRNAAIRIFADDLRSFLELVVNACDASVPPEQAVGKFGMGFFSILSLLGFQETGGTTIQIDTQYLTQKGLEGYTMAFGKTGTLGEWGPDDDITIRFANKPVVSKGRGATGTTISIRPTTKSFSKQTLEKVREYVYYMAYYPYVVINLNFRGTLEVVNKQALETLRKEEYDALPQITVVVNEREFLVKDQGTGIPLKTALLKLLIPSSSTKAAASLAQLREKIEKEPTRIPDLIPRDEKIPGGTTSNFIVTVNNVKVITVPMPNVIVGGKVADVVIPLPQAVQLTLARDDLEIAPDGNSFEERYLKKMIDQSIAQALGQQIDPNIISALYDGLKAWEDQSAAHHIKGRFSGFVKSTLEDYIINNKDLIPVPQAYQTPLSTLVGTTDKKLLAINESLINYNFSRIEDLLIESLGKNLTNQIEQDGANEKLIQGQKVYFIDDDLLPKNNQGSALVSTLGLKGMLLAPKSMLKTSSRETCSEIIASVSDYLLSSAQGEPISIPPLIITTYVDSLVDTLPIGKRFFEATQEELLNWFLETFKTDEDRNIFKDKLEFSKIESCLNLLYEIIAYSKNYQAKPSKEGYVEIIHDDTEAKDYSNFLMSKVSKLLVPWSDLKKIKVENYIINPDLALNILLVPILFPYGYGPHSKGGIYLGIENMLMQISPPSSNQKNIIDHLTILILGIAEQKLLEIDNKSEKVNFDYSIQIFLMNSIKHLQDNITKSLNVRGTYPFVTHNPPLILCFKNKPPDELSKLQQYIQDACFRSIKHITTLNTAIEGMPHFYRLIVHLHELNDIAQKYSKEFSSQIGTIISVAQGLYERYLNIDNNEFQRIYGEKNIRDQAIASINDVSPYEYITMLKTIDYNPNLLKKLMVFQNIDFTFQADPLLRRQDLIKHQFYIPSILSNTPCSLLARIYKESSNADLVKKIIEKVTSPEELNFLCHILLHNINIPFLKTKNQQQLSNCIEDLIEHFIRERVDLDQMRSMYHECRVNYSLNNRLQKFDGTSIIILVHDYLDQTLEQKIFFKTLDTEPVSILARTLVPDNKSWLLSHLMRAHTKGTGFQENLIQGNIDAVNTAVTAIDKPLDVGKITQAVEAGSEKSPIEASIVECLQNSVDAIRGFFKKLHENDAEAVTSYNKRKARNGFDDKKIIEELTTIEYELATVKTADPNKDHMLLTLTDHVGMPGLETLLTDLILPDYSNKSREQGNVGDMGNGTFKLYQDATAVTFITRSMRNPEKIFLLLAEPQRNEDGLVADLKLSCCDVSIQKEFGNFFGTKISVLFRPQEKIANNLQLFATRNFLLNCCGATNVHITHNNQDRTVSLQLKTTDEQKSIQLNHPLELVWQHPQQGKTLFMGYRRGGQLLQSYLTTNGIPFRPLREVSKQLELLPENLLTLINDGVIIDLALDTYQPVQSRTKLKFPPERKDALLIELKQCCREVLWREGIHRAKDDEQALDLYFTHYLSQAEYDQLIPSSSGADDLHKAFTEHQQFIPHSTFFRFYQSLDNDILRFDLGVKQYYDRVVVEEINKLPKLNLKEELDRWFLTPEIVKRIAAITSSTTNDEKLAIRSAWEIKMGELQNQRKQEIDEILKKHGSEFIGLTKPINPATQIKNIITAWVDNKMYNLIPKSLPTEALLKQYPNLKTDQEKLDAERKQTLMRTLSFKTSNIKLGNILNSSLKNYCNSVRNKLKLNKIGAFFEIGKGESILGYWNGKEIRINLATVQSIAAQLELVCKLLEGKTSAIANDPGYQSLFAVPKGTASTVAHELEHARRHALHTTEGSHDSALDIDGKHSTFDACALRSIAYAQQNSLFKTWSEKMRNKFPSVDVNNLREIIKQIEELEETEQGKQVLAEKILTSNPQ